MKKEPTRAYMYIAIIAVFILSRLIFINSKDVFFDSGENLDLFSLPNYFQAIISGHFPPHEGYILLFWPVFQLTKLLNLDPAYFVVLGQIGLGLLTLFCFYRVVSFITDKQTALVGTIIAAIIPLYWIINVTIMMENAYITFFFISLFLLTRYLTKKNRLSLHGSLFFMTLAFLTHMLSVLWLPLYLAIVFFKDKKQTLKLALLLFMYLSLASALNILFIATISQTSIQQVIHHFYFTKSGEIASLPLNLKGILIASRNAIIPLLRNNTSLLVVLGCIGLFQLFKTNKKLFTIGLLWIGPAIYANQWWDSLLNGRHAVLAGFGFAFLAAYLVRKHFFLTLLLLLYLLFVSFPAVSLLHKPVPYIVEANFVKSLPKDSLLIETHFAKPQVEKTYPGKLLAVNDTMTGRDTIKYEIDQYLKQNKPIFISSGALSEPYGLYSGPYLHNITLSYAKSFELQPLIKNYTLVTYKMLSAQDNLILYKIVSDKPSTYPIIKTMRNSYRRIDFYDPAWQLINLIIHS